MLAVLVIAAALIFLIFNDPPHTVCDVQAENLKGALKGKLFSDTVNKNKIPPLVVSAQEACQQGNSAGSCFEYFSILRRAARDIKSYSSECRSELVNISEIRIAFKNGIVLMSKMAWGSHPPEPGVARLGWLSDSELGLFCLIKDVYSQGLGEEAWDEIRLNIFKELPGESPSTKADSGQIGQEPLKAIAMLTEKDLWARSIFSIRCENYR